MSWCQDRLQQLSAFCVISVSENHVYHLTNGSRFIGRTIHIVHQNGACEGSGGELVLPYVVPVHEQPVSSAVQKSLQGLVS